MSDRKTDSPPPHANDKQYIALTAHKLTLHIELRQAPVDDLEFLVRVVDHYIRRLQILVHNTPVVCERQALEDLVDVEPHIFGAQSGVQVSIVSVFGIFKHKCGVLCEALPDHVLQPDDVRVTAHALCDQNFTHHLLPFELPKAVDLHDVLLERVYVVPQVSFPICTRSKSFCDHKVVGVTINEETGQHNLTICIAVYDKCHVPPEYLHIVVISC